MANQTLDITGVVCPFCVLQVKSAIDRLSTGDELKVICDHPPAAKDSIPAFVSMNGWKCTIHTIEPGLWELNIKK